MTAAFSYADGQEQYSDLFQSHTITVVVVLNQPQCNRLANFLTYSQM